MNQNFEIENGIALEERADGWYWTLVELIEAADSWTGPFNTRKEAVEHAKTME